ncbi:hypothetical protein L6164_001842 [Bauhinia variegata]|uniref:Uncharacterized protein n=1 Tax=Bauhinia variegata TaxID=167791 RepID=A0ACB9QAN1_BAUVA|nr:hypothetical protein L6164_001842 [Bauhinia variegata]
MESSEVVAAAADEFSGIDSGWTRYIGSPLHCEIYNDDDRSADMEEYNSNDRGNDDNNGDDDDGDENDSGEDSDDSMASDASSGPSKFEVLCINSETSHDTHQSKHADDGKQKLISGKKAGKQVRKIIYERKFEEGEQKGEDIAAGKKDSMLKADSVGSNV